jgi:hypothetical protein
MKVVSLAVALGVGACGGEAPSDKSMGASSSTQAAKGTGLSLDSVTGLSLPLIGKLGDVTINQAVITNFALIENTVGQIVGLQVDGVLQLTGGVLGTNVVTENFTTTASVTSSGPGQCNLVGSLLCNLGSALSGLLGGTGAAPGAGGIVNALNNVI